MSEGAFVSGYDRVKMLELALKYSLRRLEKGETFTPPPVIYRLNRILDGTATTSDIIALTLAMQRMGLADGPATDSKA